MPAATGLDMGFAAPTPHPGSGESWGAPASSAARSGEFEAAYRELAPMVRRTAWNLGGGEDLDDIVQETFVKLWRSWDQFQGLSQRKTWVYRVTLNAAREHWRGRGRFKAALRRFWTQAPRQEAVPGGQAAWEEGSRIAKALDGISQEQREAVTLVYLEGLSLAEAAQVCGAPEGTLKSRLFHARARLRELLEESHHG